MLVVEEDVPVVDDAGDENRREPSDAAAPGSDAMPYPIEDAESGALDDEDDDDAGVAVAGGCDDDGPLGAFSPVLLLLEPGPECTSGESIMRPPCAIRDLAAAASENAADDAFAAAVDDEVEDDAERACGCSDSSSMSGCEGGGGSDRTSSGLIKSCAGTVGDAAGAGGDDVIAALALSACSCCSSIFARLISCLVPSIYM